MGDASGNGVRLPMWMIGMIIPILLAGAAVYATVNSTKDHESRIRILEYATAGNVGNNAILLEVRNKQTEMREDLAAIKAKLGIEDGR